MLGPVAGSPPPHRATHPKRVTRLDPLGLGRNRSLPLTEGSMPQKQMQKRVRRPSGFCRVTPWDCVLQTMSRVGSA